MNIGEAVIKIVNVIQLAFKTLDGFLLGKNEALRNVSLFLSVSLLATLMGLTGIDASTYSTSSVTNSSSVIVLGNVVLDEVK